MPFPMGIILTCGGPREGGADEDEAADAASNGLAVSGFGGGDRLTAAIGGGPPFISSM